MFVCSAEEERRSGVAGIRRLSGFFLVLDSEFETLKMMYSFFLHKGFAVLSLIHEQVQNIFFF